MWPLTLFTFMSLVVITNFIYAVLMQRFTCVFVTWFSSGNTCNQWNNLPPLLLPERYIFVFLVCHFLGRSQVGYHYNNLDLRSYGFEEFYDSHIEPVCNILPCGFSTAISSATLDFFLQNELQYRVFHYAQFARSTVYSVLCFSDAPLCILYSKSSFGIVSVHDTSHILR